MGKNDIANWHVIVSFGEPFKISVQTTDGTTETMWVGTENTGADVYGHFGVPPPFEFSNKIVYGPRDIYAWKNLEHLRTGSSVIYKIHIVQCNGRPWLSRSEHLGAFTSLGYVTIQDVDFEIFSV